MRFGLVGLRSSSTADFGTRKRAFIVRVKSASAGLPSIGLAFITSSYA